MVQTQGRGPKLSVIFYLIEHFSSFLLYIPSCHTHSYIFKREFFYYCVVLFVADIFCFFKTCSTLVID